MDTTPPPVQRLRAADFVELENTLLDAFDGRALERLTRVLLGQNLEAVVATRDRNLADIVQSLIIWVREHPEIGVRGLLDAACRQNPTNPDLRLLQQKWAGRIDAAPTCPYPGMKPYREGDNLDFCGRRKEIADALFRLANHPFLAVIGPSGSGKSSLVFAGIVPALRQGAGSLELCTVRPGTSPQAAKNTLQTVVGARPAGTTLALVVDQFEEVFSAEETEAADFQQALAVLAEQPGVYLLLTVRADFYANLFGSPIWREFRSHRLELETLKGDALAEAIVAPAAAVGVRLDDDLVAELRHDAADQPGALPFLQAALQLLWPKVSGFRLRNDAYRQLADRETGRSGLQVAMAQWADLCFAVLTDEQQTLAKIIFLRLVQFGQGRPDTRRQMAVVDICPTLELKPQFDAVVAVLIDHRLLTADSDGTTAGSMDGDRDGGSAQRKLDIAHEALLTGWPRLAGWIKETRPAEQARRRLADKADEWQRLGGGQGGLLDELELREAEAWAKEAGAHSVLVDEKIGNLLTASQTRIAQQHAEEEASRARELHLLRERNSRQAILLIGAVLFSLFAIGALFFIWDQQAELAAQLAQSRSREVAAVASNLLDGGEAQEALLLGLVAQYGIARTAEAEQVLRSAADAWRGVGTLPGHSLPVTGLYFSRDNRYLVSGSSDKTARVWDWQARKLLWTLAGHGFALTGAAISFDNNYVITASKEDGLVRVWRMADGRLLHELKHDDNVRSLALHPNGRWLAVRVGPNVTLWDIVTGAQVAHSPYTIPSGAQLRALTWTTDGNQMLVGADDNLAHIIDIETANQGNLNLGDGRGHQSFVSSVQQSPDRRYIASMSSDLLELWQWVDTAEGGRFEYIELPDARNSEGYRAQLQFSPDGRYLAAGSANGKVRIWNMQHPQAQPIQLVGHTQEIAGLNFSPDGKALATGSRDGLVLLWNMETQAPTTVVRTQPGNVSAPIFDRAGEVLATSDNSGMVHLWRVRLGGNIGAFDPPGVPIQAVTAVDDVLYLAGENGTVTVWDPLHGRTEEFNLGDARLTAITRTADGRIVVGDESGAISVMDAQVRRLMTWPAHSGAVRSLVITDDGVVTSAGGDAAVKQWQIGTGSPLDTYYGHTNDVRSLALDPTTGHIWSAAADGQVIEHIPHQGEQAARVLTAGQPLTALAISPDGRLVAAGDIASRLHVWNLVTGAYWTQKIAKPLTSMVFVAPERLITGDEAGQLQFWNIAERTAATLQAHSERRSVRTLATFASGRLLASIGDDGQVKIWPIQDGDLRALACRRAERKLRADEWRDLFTFAANIDVCGGEPSAAAAVPTTDSRGQPAAGPLPVALSAAHVATIGGNQDGKWSGLPLIYSFEALSGTIVAPGAPVLLRWTTQNAGGGVFLGVNGSEPQPVASPGQQTFTFAADSLVRLTAHNDVGTQSMDIRIDVLGVPPGE